MQITLTWRGVLYQSYYLYVLSCDDLRVPDYVGYIWVLRFRVYSDLLLLGLGFYIVSIFFNLYTACSTLFVYIIRF